MKPNLLLSVLGRILGSPAGIIVLLYGAAHALLLVNSGIYWDDWTLFEIRPEIRHGLFLESFSHGAVVYSSLHNLIFALPHGPLAAHGATFLLYLLAALFLYGILGSFRDTLSAGDRLLITLIFALLPVNHARIAVICFPYAVFHCSFFAGWYLLTRHLAKPRIHLRILSLLLFFYSFFLLSIVAFYAVVIAFLIYNQVRGGGRLWGLVRFADFLLLPVFYWIVKVLFFTVREGVLVGYYDVSLQNIMRIPVLAPLSFLTSFVRVIDSSVLSLTFSMLCLAGVLAMILFRVLSRFGEKTSFARGRWFLVGAAVFLLAAVPYAAAGMVPTSQSWESRNQLLFPLGAALMLHFGLAILGDRIRVPVRLRIFVVAALLVSFSGANVRNYLEYQRDWYKQIALIDAIKHCEEIRDNTTFFFEDAAVAFNQDGRNYNFYELSGMMKQAFGDQRRFGATSRQQFEWFHSPFFFTELYSLKDYSLTSPQRRVIVKPGVSEEELDLFEVFKLMLASWVMPRERFESKIRRIVNLECAME